MATKTKSAGRTKKKELPIVRLPGKEQLEGFLRENPKLFNFSEFERLADLPPSTLRYIRADKNLFRPMTQSDYEKLKVAILPKMCEFVLLLQNYQ